MSTTVGTTTTNNSVSSKLSMFASKESIRTIIEIIVLIGVCYYFNKKHAKTFKHLEEMSQRLEDQEDMFEKQNAVIKDLSEKVEMLMQKQVRQPTQQQQVSDTPQYQSFQPQKVTQLHPFQSPPQTHVAHEQPKFQSPPQTHVAHEQPKFQSPPQTHVAHEQHKLQSRTNTPPEKVEDKVILQQEDSSTKKKRARSPGPESSSAVEILNDDDMENELENELKELE